MSSVDPPNSRSSLLAKPVDKKHCPACRAKTITWGQSIYCTNPLCPHFVRPLWKLKGEATDV